MASFHSLAPELVLSIAQDLPLVDIKQFRLVSRQAAELLEQQVLRTIHLTTHREVFRSNLVKVQEIAKSDAVSSVRELVINSTIPFDAFVESDSSEPFEKTQEAMASELAETLALFEEVKTVTWLSAFCDDPWIRTTVIQSLKRLPRLRHISFTIHRLDVGLPLQLLANLDSISISIWGSMTKEVYHETLLNLSHLIAYSPNLSQLEMDWGYFADHAVDVVQDLHRLFQSYPPHQAPLKLRRLSLEGCSVRLDDIILPHLQHLTSLHLVNLLNQDQGWLPSFGESAAIGSFIDDIWVAVANLQIQLKDIEVDSIPVTLFDYLETYSGLERLTLGLSHVYDPKSLDPAATRFFKDSLPHHAPSIKYLSVQAGSESLWYFGAHNIAAISQCTRLEDLYINVCHDRWATDSSSQYGINQLVSLGAVTLTRLATLGIFFSTPESPTGSHFGREAAINRHRLSRSADDCLRSYRAPISSRHHPVVYLESAKYSPVVNDGVYRYTCSA